MVETVDYNINGSVDNGAQTLLTIDHLLTDPEHYFREVFSAMK